MTKPTSDQLRTLATRLRNKLKRGDGFNYEDLICLEALLGHIANSALKED